MRRYIDAEKLKRFVEGMGLTPQKSADYNDGRDDAKMMVLDFIDSLQRERPEVDLEEEIATWIPSHITGGEEGIWKECREAVTKWAGIVAHHFYELGLKARKEE